MRTWEIVVADLAATAVVAAPTSRQEQLRLVLSGLVTVKGIATVGFRLSHALGQRRPWLGSLVKQVTQALTGADIAHSAQIGPGLRIYHPAGIVVAGDSVIGSGCVLHSGVVLGGGPGGPPVIGDDVELASGAKLASGVKIGNRCRVGFNAVVTRAEPIDDLTYVGVPARPRPRRYDEGDTAPEGAPASGSAT